MRRQNEVKQKTFLFDEVKINNIGGQFLTKFKEFSLDKQTKPRMGYEGIGKLFGKKRKIEKTLKINVITTLKLEQKDFKPQNYSLFRSTSCFGMTKISTPI